jgi:hypothetical protein
MPGAVHEEKWCLVICAKRSFVYELKPLSGPLPGSSLGRRGGSDDGPVDDLAVTAWRGRGPMNCVAISRACLPGYVGHGVV